MRQLCVRFARCGSARSRGAATRPGSHVSHPHIEYVLYIFGENEPWWLVPCNIHGFDVED